MTSCGRIEPEVSCQQAGGAVRPFRVRRLCEGRKSTFSSVARVLARRLGVRKLEAGREYDEAFDALILFTPRRLREPSFSSHAGAMRGEPTRDPFPIATAGCCEPPAEVLCTLSRSLRILSFRPFVRPAWFLLVHWG